MAAVHTLLAGALLLFTGWLFGMIGVMPRQGAWWFLMGSWWLGMMWCYAYYMLGAHPIHRHHFARRRRV
jgi:hypothetical protein